MQQPRAALLVVAAAASLAAAGVVLQARSGSAGVQPAGARQSRPIVVVAHASAPADSTAIRAVAMQPRAVAAAPPAPADATGWPGPPATFALPETKQATCESSSIPHPANFTVMRSQGVDSLSGHGDHATYADHVTVQTVCDNLTPNGDLALEVVVYPYGGDASDFHLTAGPSGLTVVSVSPGHGAETVAVGRRIAAYPGACGTLSLSDAGTTHVSINDTLCFDGSGRLTHAELHESSTLADGDTRRLDATFDPAR